MAKIVEKERISQVKGSKIPKYLVYERVEGRPIYYKNYEKVLKGELPAEVVMGSGELQALLIGLILKYLYKFLSEDYVILTNELGFYTSPKSFRSLDIAVYRKESMKKPSSGYSKKIPVAVIEIDTKADLKNYRSFEEYMYEKTEELLSSGVEMVVWYLTRVKKVLVAERGKDWITSNWDKEINLPIGVKLNLKGILEEEGIEV